MAHSKHKGIAITMAMAVTHSVLTIKTRNPNFFELGAHSLLGTQLITRVRDTFGIEIPLRAMFEAPTIAELSLEIDRLLLAKVEAMSEEEVLQLLSSQPQNLEKEFA